MADDSLKDVPYEAPWTDNLRLRPDPNRVSSLQIAVAGAAPRPPAAQGLPPDTGTSFDRPLSSATASPRHDPQARPAEASYYDIPMLKEPVWKWQIASYFFFGGVSGGAYILGRLADRAGNHKNLARVASYVSLATLLPCPPLLISDLGDPKRFHHMLRVWKPTTPMNLGTWAITAYGGMAGFEAVRQFLNGAGRKLDVLNVDSLRKLLNNSAVMVAHDAAGVPFALMVACYTGVLLSCSSNPLWCKNPWLGPLFAASAVSTGAEAISLAMDCAGEKHHGQKTLRRVDTIAHIVEFLMLRGFMKYAGENADPLRRGKTRKHHELSIGALIAAEVLKRVPAPRPLQKPKRMLTAALGLAGGFALRLAMVAGGREAAADPHLSRVVSRPRGRTA